MWNKQFLRAPRPHLEEQPIERVPDNLQHEHHALNTCLRECVCVQENHELNAVGQGKKAFPKGQIA